MLNLLKNLDKVTKELFNIKLYDYQKEIVEAIFSKNRKITIKATTRAGKSYTLALALLLYILCFPKTKIGIIATTQHKTKIIYTYVADFLAQCPELASVFDIKVPKDDITRLRAEASKQKLTTKQGGYIEVLTADLPSGGQALMGRAYDLTAVDESAELSQEAWSKIYRMLVENPESKIIEIYNPWYLNHTYEHWNDDTWIKVHIPWQKCVKAGRITKDAVEDQKANLTDLEFKVLFEAEFPENIEKAIFTEDILQLADRKQDLPKTFDKVRFGVDVARGGNDLSVVTIIGIKDNILYYIDHKQYDIRDLMVLVGYVKQLEDIYKGAEIVVDTVGIGAGVKDKLLEDKYNVFEFVSGSKAKRSDRFYHLKTEALFGLKDIMKAGKFYNLPSKHRFELKKYTFDPKGDKTIKSCDPEDKSPDFADSLMLACYEPPKTIITKLNW